MAGFDLAVVGAGVVGLAHALAGLRRGLKVVVLDREAQCIGASVRNFGFVAVTGQEAGQTWARARRSRDIWVEVAAKAGFAVEQQGLLVAAQRPEAVAVLEAFLATEMGADCRMVRPKDYPLRVMAGAMWSPHERRVESREAIPKLAAWLEAQGVRFLRPVLVRGVAPGVVETSAGPVMAQRIVVCPGDDLQTLFADQIAGLGITRCRLQMMRVQPQAGFRLPGAVMSDLSLVRYGGYACLPEAAALKARLEAEMGAELAAGIHLIAVLGADGGLVVGDSHHYEDSPSPFASGHVDAMIFKELQRILPLEGAEVVERWQGTYANLPDKAMVRLAPDAAIRLVIVTSGTGASTGFAIGEETVDEMFRG